jgi:erythrocyte band 7 integral membrane protein
LANNSFRSTYQQKLHIFCLLHNPEFHLIIFLRLKYCSHSTRLLAATTLRNVLGTKNLSQILAEREAISQTMQSALDEATEPWGVKVERVKVKDVRLPIHLQRAMATEAEAAREARAKVLNTHGRWQLR